MRALASGLALQRVMRPWRNAHHLVADHTLFTTQIPLGEKA
jgi:hypothetical protein